MAQWEYAVRDISVTGTKVIRVLDTFGKDYKEGSGQPLEEYLNSMGEQGWELFMREGDKRYIFKRPKG